MTMPPAQAAGNAQGAAVPTRFPLLIQAANRADTPDKDARLVNCYGEKTPEGDFLIYKRAGLSTNATLSKTGNGYGLYNWRGNVYAAIGSSLYKDGTSIGTIDTTAGVYYFSQSLGATPRLVLGNGVKAYTYDGTTFAQITDADFPTAFVKGWSYLDATTYVGLANAGIQGSDLNDPTSWDPLNLIVAQIEPDRGVAMGKQLVYTILFKEWTTEVFYDAANSVGSPLGTVQGAKVSFGCLSANSVQSIGDVLLWVSTTREASPQIIKMAGLKAEVVSTPAIERLLRGEDFSSGVFSWSFKDGGHSFYILTVKNANLTLAYDISENLWWQLTDSSGNYFPIVASTFDSSNRWLVQHESNGKVYYMDRSYTSDDGSAITVDGYTPNFDGGVDRVKTLQILRILADQEEGSLLQLRCNDQDFSPTKWTEFRAVDLGTPRPFLKDCGTFRRRAYNFRHQSNTPLRLRAMDMQLDLGTA